MFMRTSIAILSFLFLTNCSNDDRINNCNYLLNVGVNFSLNLNLPEYSQLLISLNTVYVPNQGNAGVYVINTGNGNFRAWDAADPSHIPSACSLMQRDGIAVTCGCEDANTYEIITGASTNSEPLPCRLQEYRATRSGNTITVSN